MADLLSSLASTGAETPLDRLVSMYMTVERQPVDSLKAKKDQLTIQSSVFSDLSTKLNGLLDLAKDLSASSTSSVFSGHSVSSSDTAKVSGTAYPSATNGSYVLSNVTLATAHRVSADKQLSTWTTSGAGSFYVNGKLITIDAGKSLVDLKNAINSATYDSGKEVVASIVDNTLVLEAKSSGAANAITASDDTGGVLASIGLLSAGSFAHTLQGAGDAQFTVNGVSVTRSRNTDLNDVIGGLAFDLKGTWKAGDTATLEVTNDTTNMRSKIDAFLAKLNDVTDYLKAKSAVTKGSDDNYTRGPLNGYTLYTMLYSYFSNDMTSQVAGLPAAAPTTLSALGIEMDRNMHFVVEDSDKLGKLLSNNADGVAAFFGGSDGVAKRVYDRLEPYVKAPSSTSKSYIDQELDSISSTQSALDGRIATLNERLTQRERELRSQFTRLQAQYIEATQLQSQLSSIFSSVSY